MKSIIIISVVTFVLIFGGVVVLSTQLSGTAAGGDLPELAPEDYAAAERVFHDMAVERDRIQQERESLLALQRRIAVQEKVLDEGRKNLLEVVQKLETKQVEFIAERDRSATKLAKMYEAMKPDQAAPILGALDPEIILEIMARMKERPAARILAKMDPALAAQISTRMSLKGGN